MDEKTYVFGDGNNGWNNGGIPFSIPITGFGNGFGFRNYNAHELMFTIKKALGLESASGRPNKDKVGQLTQAQVREIAQTKMPDLNAASIESAMSMVKGTARSMGITVADE